MFRNIFAAALLVLAIAGCAKSPSVVGTWKTEMVQGGVTVASTYVFNEDKTFSMTTGAQGVELIIPGSYTSSDTTLTLTPDLDKTQVKVPQALAAQETVIREALKKSQGKSESLQVEWQGADEFKATIQGQVVVFKRST